MDGCSFVRLQTVTALRTVRVHEVFHVFTYNWNNKDDKSTVHTWRGRPAEDDWDYIYASGGYIDGVGVNLQTPDPGSIITGDYEKGLLGAEEKAQRCF
jgi:hypothetical protein